MRTLLVCQADKYGNGILSIDAAYTSPTKAGIYAEALKQLIDPQRGIEILVREIVCDINVEPKKCWFCIITRRDGRLYTCHGADGTPLETVCAAKPGELHFTEFDPVKVTGYSFVSTADAVQVATELFRAIQPDNAIISAPA